MQNIYVLLSSKLCDFKKDNVENELINEISEKKCWFRLLNNLKYLLTLKLPIFYNDFFEVNDILIIKRKKFIVYETLSKKI